MRRYSALLVIMCAVALALVGCAQDATPAATDTAPAPGVSEAASKSSDIPSSDDDQAAGVTMAQFEQIKKGMTYDQVVAILGEPTETMSEAEASGVTFKVYGWTGDKTASAVTVGLMDGEVNSMNQTGLD
jgi:hypothetical protein